MDSTPEQPSRSPSLPNVADPQPLRTADLTPFWARLVAAPLRVLCLDYDGTLAPFRVARDRAYPYPEVREVVAAVQAAGGTRVVVVSGRPVAEIVPLLGVCPVPEIWGSHGWERRQADDSASAARSARGSCGEPATATSPGSWVELPAEVTEVLGKAWQRLQRIGHHQRGERKPASVAVHWRGLPAVQSQEIRSQVHAQWQQLAEVGNLELLEFDGGLELRARGRDKGHAVRTLLAETGPRAVMAYLGDDRTDEDAFCALRRQDLAVLVRSDSRPTAARYWLRPPEELLFFLRRWAAETQPPAD